MARIHGQPADAQHRRGIARQFQVWRQLFRRHLAGADGHEADGRCLVIGERDVGLAETPALLLPRLSAQKVVQRGFAAVKTIANVPFRQ